ncbi:DM13 domain-containing protein [Candidatus Poriferisocius sp.]|uniref:DM13 domain-containing protein n=1 Tax=Candidatus Poriferisocius sp. TaxID=3101276 RepID=UPI003B02158E
MKRLISRLWGWLKKLSVRAKVLLAVLLATLSGFLIWAVFFWFAFQTYFIDDKVDEAGPVFDSGAAADTPLAEPDATTPTATEPAAPQPTAGDSGAPDSGATTTASEPATAAPTTAAGPMPGDELSEELVAEMDEAMEELGMPEEQPVTETMPDMPQVRVEASGEFIRRSHPTQGQVDVLGDGTGQRFLRFEDFRTDNGPDLNVYLSAAPPDAPAGQFDDDFVDLGDLKGNVGSQNYEIPRDLDLDVYSTVVIWCVRFSVIFGAADLVAS